MVLALRRLPIAITCREQGEAVVRVIAIVARQLNWLGRNKASAFLTTIKIYLSVDMRIGSLGSRIRRHGWIVLHSIPTIAASNSHRVCSAGEWNWDAGKQLLPFVRGVGTVETPLEIHLPTAPPSIGDVVPILATN